jgi:hypothetical protein
MLFYYLRLPAVHDKGKDYQPVQPIRGETPPEAALLEMLF